MMRKLFYILFIILALSFVMSCGRSVDKRLVLADTLMWTNPDSSLTILNAIYRDSLQGEENLAYHALLLTQAQFRCNIPLTSDTLISKAVDYYSDNHNREHYTRALLYKGGAYEDMGNPVEAIKWYKQAEDNADSTDYRNLAQINMRMGIIYYNNLIDKSSCISKFDMANHYYSCLNDKNNIMISMGFLGSLYRNLDNDKAISLLNNASKIAIELNDSSDLFWYKELLSRTFFLVGDYEKSKQIAVEAIADGGDYVHEDTYFNAALAYAKLGASDSARYYFPDDNYEDYYHLAIAALTKGSIAEAEGDLQQALIENHRYEAFSDSAQMDSVKMATLLNESITAKHNSDKHKKQSGLMKKYVLYAIIISSVIIISIVLFFIFKKRQLNKLIISLQGQKVDLHNDLIEIIDQKSSYYAKLKENKDLTDEKIKEIRNKEIECNALRKLVRGHVDMMKKLVESSEHDSPRVFNDTFKMIVKDNFEQSQIEAFVNFANQNFNNVINKSLELNPNLNLKEQFVIALMAAGFDYKEISLLTGYTANFVGEKRIRIQKKLGLECKLIDFINKVKGN